ncbi:MAG: hypothetical protein ABIH49_01740 [archaeon]
MKKVVGNFPKNKRGQLTIFIIIAIVIVGVAAMIYFLFPGILVNLGIGASNPDVFMKSCLEDGIKNSVQTISTQGGSLEPENYILYKDEKIEFLCYINEDYKPCVMQQPFLKNHIENEIEGNIQEDVTGCLETMKENFERQGYEVSLSSGDTGVELLPEKLIVTLNTVLTLRKEETQRFEKINVVLNNNLYELVSIAESILNYEATYGDAETTLYMSYYPHLKVEKPYKETDGTIYVLTDRNTGDKFQFASRSVKFPAGY